ncbi:MAG TPA: HlyD family efflux transporter periplasmic adaptor subunit [Polyangiaceae bacterium]|nr:HlyD family efflux transporter periplasmic adaptor subunit [Polyangiaceae bacterium]
MSRRRALLRVGVAVAAVAVGLVLARKPLLRRLEAAPSVPTYEVRMVPFARQVTAEGNLRAVKADAISSPTIPDAPPLKISWLACDGCQVHTGDVVARFDPTDFQKRLKDGQSDRATAEAKIGKERSDTEALLRDRDRTTDLSQAELAKQEKFVAKDTLIFSRNQIIESSIDKQLWGAKMDNAEQEQKLERSLSQSKVDLLALEKRKAEIAMLQAQMGLDKAEVTAPHDGILIIERDWRGNLWKVGDTVWPGLRLASLPVLDEMEVEAFVLEADAGGLSIGLPASITLEANPDVVYKATIKNIDKLAKPRLRDVPINYFSVVLALEHTDQDRMKPGQRARTTMSLDERRALAVPREAVFEKEGRKVVYVASGTAFEERPVTLDVSSPGLVVIQSGVREGDRIALRDPTRPTGAAGDRAAQGTSP